MQWGWWKFSIGDSFSKRISEDKCGPSCSSLRIAFSPFFSVLPGVWRLINPSWSNLISFSATRGLYYNQPGHSCKDIRDSGFFKKDGEYWIDPEKNGKPLKVYCDMTIDGGKNTLENKRKSMKLLLRYVYTAIIIGTGIASYIQILFVFSRRLASCFQRCGRRPVLATAFDWVFLPWNQQLSRQQDAVHHEGCHERTENTLVLHSAEISLQ